MSTLFRGKHLIKTGTASARDKQLTLIISQVRHNVLNNCATLPAANVNSLGGNGVRIVAPSTVNLKLSHTHHFNSPLRCYSPIILYISTEVKHNLETISKVFRNSCKSFGGRGLRQKNAGPFFGILFKSKLVYQWSHVNNVLFNLAYQHRGS